MSNDGIPDAATSAGTQARTGGDAPDRDEGIRDLIDAMPLLFWTARPDGFVESCNARWCEYTGLSLEQSLGDGWKAVLHEGDRAATEAAIGAAFTRGHPYEVEQRLRRHDGAYRWFLVRGTPVRDAAGVVYRWGGANLDIHERKEAEAKLAESESRWAFAIQSTKIGVLDWNVRTGEMQFSDRWLELAGYTRDELPPRVDALTALVHPDDLPVAMADLQEVLAGRKAAHAVLHRLRHKMGHWLWVESRSLVSSRDEQGAPLRMIGTHLDISERRRVEQALERSEALLNSTGEIAKVGGWRIDLVSQSLSWTKEVYRIHEVDERFEPTVAGGIDFYALESRPLIAAAVQAAIEHGRAFDLELQIVTARGTRRWVRAIGHAVSTEGTVREVLGTFQDISERKQAEADRARLEAQLQQAQKMESVGRLAGGIAHDFNNMLGVILGHTGMALEELDPSMPLHADLVEIEAAARRSAELTRQLLAFARKQSIRPVSLDLNATVTGMRKMLQRLLGEDIEFQWRPGEALWSIKADPSQLDQILANLCVNARDAMVGGGRLTVTTGNVTLDEAWCASRPEAAPGDYVQLTVADSGAGMDAETLTHLFEPFFTTKMMGKGTGLGLATVYGIVKQGRGFLDVVSALGAGTTFTVYLPRHAGSAWKAGPEAPSAADPRGHETILLVEDEPGMLRVTRLLLERQGYTVLFAATPGDALRLLDTHEGPLHLLLTDVVMPQMNGAELSTRVAALRPAMKHLFMSGHTANIIERRGVLGEGVNFLPKPFSRTELATAVRAALDRP